MGKRIIVVLGMLALLLPMAFAEGQQETGGGEAEMTEVQFSADGFLLGSQSWVAKEKGYFQEENIAAKVSMFGTGIEAIQAVIAQQAELGPALDFAVLNLAAAAEEHMQVVACIAAPKPGFHSLAVRNNINGPKDLEGKKIGYVEGTSEHYVTVQYLKQHDVDQEKVELVKFPGLYELVGALRTNEIQASWLWLSGTEEAKKSDKMKILTDDSDVLDTGAIYLVTQTEWAKNNQDTLVRVLRAYDKASQFINENTQKASQIVADSVDGNAEQFAKIMPNQQFRVKFTQTQLESLDTIAQFLINTGKLEEDFNIRNFINFEAMRKAVPGSVQADLE